MMAQGWKEDDNFHKLIIQAMNDFHEIEIWSAKIVNIMNKSILEVDDIEICSAEVLKFCTSLAPKIPSNPWQNIANITENLLIVVSTSFVVLFVNHVSKKERIQIWNGKPFSHFFLILIWDYFRKQDITEVYLTC